MTLKPGDWRQLTGEERLCARMERIATSNTIFGGASALLKAKRLRSMGGTDLGHVVGEVYSNSTGNRCRTFGAWECPECGSTHLGQDAALNCCSNWEDGE